MKKKKILKIIFLTILLISSFVPISIYLFNYIKTELVNINETVEEESDETYDEDTNEAHDLENNDSNEKKVFAKNNLDISFKLEQKLYILNFTKNEPYFNLPEFKYYFLIEFQKLGPVKNNIILFYNFDNEDFAKNIKVEYQENSSKYIWNFSLN